MRQSPLWIWILGMVEAIGLSAGCRASRQIRDPEYAGVVNAMAQAPSAPVDATVPPAAPPLAGPQPVEVYIGYALAQNPDIQAARKRVEAAGERVPQVASLPDPMLGVTAYPAAPQTAAGQQRLSVSASQQLPWFGKLNTRAGAAEADWFSFRMRGAATQIEACRQPESRRGGVCHDSHP